MGKFLLVFPLALASHAALAHSGHDSATLFDGFSHPLIPRMEAFLAANGIGVGAIEFVTDAAGETFAYDVNTNTNYNPEAERRAGHWATARDED